MAQKISRKGAEDVNIFARGVLVLLQINCPQFTTKFPEDKFGEEIPKEIVRAVYDLIEDKTLIDSLNSLRSRAKRWMYDNSIPFPYDGFCFIPKERIEAANAYMEKLQEEWNEIVEDVVAKLPELEKVFKSKYPDLYKPEKYPTGAALTTKFRFRWTFRVFETPDAKLGVLTPALYKQEMARFREDIAEMKKLTMATVGNAFLEKLDSLKRQCSNDTVRSNTVESVHTFLEKFDDLWDGFIGQKELRKWIQDCKDYMDGTNAEMLQADEEFRAVVGQKMKQITEELKSQPYIKSKRAIEL